MLKSDMLQQEFHDRAHMIKTHNSFFFFVLYCVTFSLPHAKR